MKRKEKNSKGVMSLALAAIVILSVLTVGIMPVSGLPTAVRSIEPDTVSAGGVVDVTIEFTTTVSNLFLDINDYVPIGWPVSDMSANIEPDVAEFDPATGEVFFRWIGVPISPGTHIRAEYKLHVPAGWPDVDSYILEGVLQRSTEPRTIPISGDDTVSVKEPSKVSLSVDDNTKVTDANVDAVYYLTVENAGVTVDTYDLAITSNEADFAELSQSSVTLGPGVSDEVVLRVSSFLAGDYDTTVEATSGGASDAITVTTTVEPFYTVSLDASPETKEVQTNEIATFTITATNQGNAPDVVDLSIIDFGVTSASTEYRKLSEDTFVLGVGADATAYFNFTSAAPGVYEKTIKANSQGDHLVSDMVVTTSTVIPRTKASVPTVTRTITPDTPVAPGDVVNVMIEFTTTDQYVYLYLSDNVPEAWNVPEESMSENSGLPEDLLFLGFDETDGEVYFKWVPIEDPEDPGMEPGTYLLAEYALHVPADAAAGVYNLQGDLTLWTDFTSDPSIAFVAGDGTVEVVTGPPDEEPPIITNVASSSINSDSATITWDTDEASDSLVKYGTAPGVYTLQEDDAASVTSHNIGLTGLAANTTYYYVVNSTDPSGNSAESGENSFTTLAAPDEEPPVISNVASSAIMDDSATITWDTDELSDSLVKYGTTPGTYTMQGSDDTDVTSHSIGLSGLTPNTTYYYVVNSTDLSGNSAESGENSFTTFPEGLCFAIDFAAGYNMITMPRNDSSVIVASHLANKIGANATEIVRWDSATQMYVSFIPTVPLNNFDIVGGEGYFVNVDSSTPDVQFCGDGWASPFDMSLVTGFNMIGMPVNDTSVTDASSLATKIGGNVTEIVRWNSGTQMYVSFIPGVPLNNFDIIGGEGYFVNVNNPSDVTFEGVPWQD